MICLNCSKFFDKKYSKWSNGNYCSLFCARSFAHKNENKLRTKFINCIICGKLFEVNIRSIINRKCNDCKIKNIPKSFISKENIIEALKTATSMCSVARQLNVHYKTLKKYAKIYNLWCPNQSGKKVDHFDLKGLLSGNIISNIHSNTLKEKLYKYGYKENKCEMCGIYEWNNKPIHCALHHIDGNSHNNKLENLKILCPNCHSQTNNYCKGYKEKIRKVNYDNNGNFIGYLK